MRIRDLWRAIFSEDLPHQSGDPGTFVVAVRRDANTTPVDADGDYAPIIQDANGNLKVNVVTGGGTGTAATATLSNVSDSASSVTLQAANSSRLGLLIVNDSTVRLLVKFGSSASATSYTVAIAPQGYYELPAPIYTGIVTGIWDSDASGAARMTELTA